MLSGLCALLLACGDDSPTGGGGGAGGDATGGQGGSSEGTCEVGVPCDQICLFGADACDPGAVGTCHPSNGTCDGPPTGPVCDCDGVVHEGDFASCTLGADAIPFGDAAACATGTFTCGDTECVRHVEVCVKTTGGPAPGSTSYACQALSGELAGTCAGGIADCACLDMNALTDCGSGSACDCLADADNQETLTLALP